MDKHDKQLALHDKQIASMRNLLREGIPMVQEIRRLTLETRRDLRELAVAQKKTDASLKAFIDSMRGDGNGHQHKKI